MKKLYEKYLFLNPWIQGMIFLVFFYFICAIISYLSLTVTANALLEEGTSIYFNISTLSETIFIPFILTFSIMSQIIVAICGFILFGAYYWTFSKNIKRVSILPLSNQQLLIKIFKQWLVLFLAFILIYLKFLTSKSITGLGILDFIKNLNFINLISFSVNNSSSLFCFLFVIIIDMQCKNSSLGKWSSTIWCILAFGFSMWFFILGFNLFHQLNLHQLAFPIFLLILTVIELIYIFKNINNLKIN